MVVLSNCEVRDCGGAGLKAEEGSALNLLNCQVQIWLITILLIRNNKMGHRINKMGIHFNKVGHRNSKGGHRNNKVGV